MFKDNDIIEVYYGLGYEIDDKQELIGQAPYYQGASIIVHSKLDDMGVKTPFIRIVHTDEDNAFVDYGSHAKFFKLRRVK